VSESKIKEEISAGVIVPSPWFFVLS